MQMPERVPGLKVLAILVAIYSVLWISLEGKMWQVLVLSLGLMILLAGTLYQKRIAGRTLPVGRWLLLCAVAGLALGLLFGPLTILLMAVKTGLHGHGPEFTPGEINRIINRIPLFMILGALIVTGLGALLAGFTDESASN
jgi:hypothetical protein